MKERLTTTDLISDWISSHIAATVVVVFVVDALFFLLLTWLVGCAPQPRFANGDRTVIGPATYGDVTGEPGMAKPEPD